MRSLLSRFLAFSATLSLLLACANQMEPAKNALDNINATLNAASADAQKYVPDRFAVTQSKVAALNASFKAKDYEAVVRGAPALLAEVNALSPAAAAKKDEQEKALGNEWRSLEASIPQSLAAIQARLDVLAKMRRPPKGIDVSTAKSSLDDASQTWDRAKTAFKSGNPPDAVNIAKDSTAKIQAAANALKLDLPPG